MKIKLTFIAILTKQIKQLKHTSIRKSANSTPNSSAIAEKIKSLSLTGITNYGIVYGILGILALSSVFVIGVEQYGSVNWIKIFGITIQPSLTGITSGEPFVNPVPK